MKIRLAINVENIGWKTISGAVGAVRRAAKATSQAVELGDVVVLLADDARLCDLNATYRGKAKPTNVLSFPRNDDGDGCGDIALALETVLHEAKVQGKTPVHHLSHLVVHGLLHLCGYDHVKLAEARRMEALEKMILLRLGIADPYLIAERKRHSRPRQAQQR